MNRQRFAQPLTYFLLFLLPWQTRWIFSEQHLQGEVWEYGKLSLYGVELLMGILFLLRAKKIRWSPTLLVPIVITGSTLFLSLFFSEHKFISLVTIGHIVFIVGFVLCLLCKDLSLSAMLKAFFVGLIIPCFLGWFQVLTGSSPVFSWLGLAGQNTATLGTSVVEISSERLLRAYGSFPHPNIFGGYLVLTIIFTFVILK